MASGKQILRKSGIELLKIFAILLIITNHVVQTLCEPNEFVSLQAYLMDISHATKNIQQLLVTMLRYSGVFGNTLFFVCSAWFFLGKKVQEKSKICHMIADVYVFSLLFLITVFITNNGNVDSKLIIKALFPTIFANNWYITCYILFCLLYPLLNKIIYSLSQQQLLRISMFLALLYIGMNYIKENLFFPSDLILWVTIYFVMAYIKLYMSRFCVSVRANVALFCVGVAGNCGIIILTNCLGLKISFFADKLMYWENDCSPFLILAAIGLFNIARRPNWKIKWINSLSGCSLLIYIIHENLLVRTYYRPVLWQYVYTEFEGEEHTYVLFWIFVLVVIIFIISLLIALLYKKLIQSRVYFVCDKIVQSVEKAYNQLEIRLLKIK